jgi:hypothetical protein
MEPSSKLGPARFRALWASSLVCACIFFLGGVAHSQDKADAHLTRYETEFDGDRSLDVATIAEQVFPGYSRYVVQLDLASGAQQDVAVTGPSGGLRLEMRDMTGDPVPNDLVLIPKLLDWPPTILVNEGHNHFRVAISGVFPGFLNSGADLTSTQRNIQGSVPLICSGFDVTGLANGRVLRLPKLQTYLLLPIAQSVTARLGHEASSGRAPPSDHPHA